MAVNPELQYGHLTCHTVSVSFNNSVIKIQLGFTSFFQMFCLDHVLSLYPVEESVSCENPGVPDNGYQILSKRLYLPGESLNFMCYQGYDLIGEITIKCILGNPSFWSGPLPMCKGKACHI